MTTTDLKFSKLKNYSDIDFNPENRNKNELQLSEECKQIKEIVLSNFKSSLKEYFQRTELEKEISILNKELTSVSHKLTELHKKWQKMIEDIESKNSDIDAVNIIMYEKYLAFRITSKMTKKEESFKEGLISFEFFNIIESNPQKTCSIVLTVTEKKDYKGYKVTKCHPEVTEIEELTSRLNKTYDLHTFIKNVRKKFQQSLAERV